MTLLTMDFRLLPSRTERSLSVMLSHPVRCLVTGTPNSQHLLSVLKESSVSDGTHGLSRWPLMSTQCLLLELAHLSLIPPAPHASQICRNSELPRHKGCNVPVGYKNTTLIAHICWLHPHIQLFWKMSFQNPGSKINS